MMWIWRWLAYFPLIKKEVPLVLGAFQRCKYRVWLFKSIWWFLKVQFPVSLFCFPSGLRTIFYGRGFTELLFYFFISYVRVLWIVLRRKGRTDSWWPFRCVRSLEIVWVCWWTYFFRFCVSIRRGVIVPGCVFEIHLVSLLAGFGLTFWSQFLVGIRCFLFLLISWTLLYT